MKQILIEIDPDTAARLDKVAPARSRRRSEFIRSAIRRALWDMEERATERAYTSQPDSADDTHFDPEVWERGTARKSRGRSR
jgi:hypothetical protein